MTCAREQDRKCSSCIFLLVHEPHQFRAHPASAQYISYWSHFSGGTPADPVPWTYVQEQLERSRNFQMSQLHFHLRVLTCSLAPAGMSSFMRPLFKSDSMPSGSSLRNCLWEAFLAAWGLSVLPPPNSHSTAVATCSPYRQTLPCYDPIRLRGMTSASLFP